jgi:CRISPR-associated endonuclease/helicase Cas3
LDKHFAHAHRSYPEDDWHRLAKHLEDTADLAGRFASKFSAADWARAAALLHDTGKYSAEFQARLRGRPTPVDHSTFGAKLAVEHYGLLGRLLAYVVAGHHAGMPDGTGAHDATLAARLSKTVPDASAWRTEVVLPASLSKPNLRGHPTLAARRAGFSLSHLGRMIFSTLVDADFIDTEEYFAKLRGDTVERIDGQLSISELARRVNQSMTDLAATAEKSPVNSIRAEVLEVVRSQISLPRGLFSLTVPTGGGKTLASLVWALGHARAHDLNRIIYVAPFTSIIDQTAGVYRMQFGNLADTVVEHHSSYRETGSNERIAKHRRAQENWDARIIVTTGVQFYESLFSNRPGQCRKLHNIANSVVILDEAQSIPVDLLMPCVAMLDEMARNYGTTILLCTATQPALEERDASERSLSGGLREVRELIPSSLQLHQRLSRVTLRVAGQMTDAEIVRELGDSESGLCIVNTRRHAAELYKAARNLEGVRHLSALMCPAHRVIKLTEIRKRLKDSLPTRLIATSVVEAGVDVDFQRVWREIAGLDSVHQAAGRCNREGRQLAGNSIVTVFEGQEDVPFYMSPNVFAMRTTMRAHNDLLDPSAIETYFQALYWRRSAVQGGLDRAGVMDALANIGPDLTIPYETIATQMRIIDESMEAVIIPWDDEAKNLIKALSAGGSVRSIARQLQRYVVQVPPKSLEAMLASGSVKYIAPETLGDQFAMLSDISLYSDETGLDLP